MKINPVKGTNDYLPEQVRLRDYLQSQILNVYVENGFEHIITPVVEDAENLDKSDGGENLNLIFNILKRGDKLESVINKGVTVENQKELSDLGLRYDLTLPLSRYIANNQNELLMPMKCIQIDRVYRAERPQKGRLREFIQCDIDIIGSESSDSELDLILTTVKALKAIGLSDFTVKINDRRLLTNVLTKLGFDRDLDSVCISFDKMDKIGLDGVCAELSEKEFSAEAVENFREFLSRDSITLDYIGELLTEEDAEPVESLKNIIAMCNELSDNSFNIEFDLSLVRGQGYYTGTVFEVESIDFKGAIAGGGRYDNLIGKFLGQQVSAVGFSIGFERIFSILMEHGIDLPNKGNKIAVMYDEGELTAAYKLAEKYRAEGKICSLYVKPKKMGKFLGKLEERGYAGFINVSNDDGISYFEN